MKSFKDRSACPICGSTDFEIYFDCAYQENPVRSYLCGYYNAVRSYSTTTYNEIFGDARYKLASCKSCKGHFQVSLPTDEFLALLYGGWLAMGRNSEDAFAQYTSNTAAHYMSEAIKLTELAKKATRKPSLSALKVLDFGMGRGGFALSLKACFSDVYGFEYADDRDALGQKLGLKMLAFEDINAEQSFDLINTEQVFEHLPDPRDTAARLAAALSPGGVLKISVPYNRWLEGGDTHIDWTAGRYMKNSPIPLSPLEHLQYFRRPSLSYLGRNLGLKEIFIPKRDHLNYSFGWFGKGSVRNVGRTFFMKNFRNYCLFQKDI